MANDQNFLQAVSAIDGAISDQISDGAALAAPSTDELCRIFNTIKGPIKAIPPFVEMIPVYRKAIAKALRLLLQFGEAVCP
jgi:hypothetical protein